MDSVGRIRLRDALVARCPELGIEKEFGKRPSDFV